MTLAPRQSALSFRSVALIVGGALVGALWIRKASLLAFTILVGEGTPPVPALATLVLMAAVGMLLPRLTRSGRWRREALLVYLALTVTFITVDANGVRQLLSSLVSLRYFAAPENDYAAYADLLPSWVTPVEEVVVRGFFEGDEDGVPWGAWRLPLLVWGGAFMLLTFSLLCLGALFRRPWAEHERLTYPLAELALGLAPGPPERAQDTPLLRTPLFWVGVGLAVIYDGSNIAHAFSPGVPAIGQLYDANHLLTERPWSALRPITMTFRPEIIGLGYLVPVDVLLSVWGFFLLFRCENFLAETAGYSVGGFPFEGPQALGGYLALAAFLLWTARRHLWCIAQAAVGRGRTNDAEEAMPLRWAFWGVIAGLLGLTGLAVAMGMDLGRALTYIGLIYACCLVYARVRAQTGLPVTYIVPREHIFQAMQALSPTPGRLSRLEMRSETAFTILQSFVRMTFPQLGAFEMEGLRIGERARLRQSQVVAMLVVGVALGLVLGLGIHLHAAYDYGWNVIDGGTTQGGYRTMQALSSYQELHTRVTTRVPVQVNTTVARLVGCLLTVALMGLRVKFLRFPLNPLGLAIAGTFGHSIWFPVFMAWLCKTLILRLGGAHSFRLLSPVFMGLAIGHFLIAGGIWGLVGAFSEDVARRYLLWFA